MDWSHIGAHIGDGEHPSVVVDDVLSRPKPNSHLIVFANDKGGVGKSTMAFHCAVALANAGAKVLAIDLDKGQQSLAHALENREATARCLGAPLACPRSVVLERPSGAMLLQEIARVGSDCRFVIVDAPGHDSPIVRRAIAMADTLVTPINASFFDLDMLARFDPARMTPSGWGHFGATVAGLRGEMRRRGRKPADWIVVKNRIRSSEKRLQPKVDAALDTLKELLDLRVATGLGERVAYRELLLFGLTHPDLKRIPELSQFRARPGEAIDRLLAEMRLPIDGLDTLRSKWRREKSTPATLQRYYSSLRAHVGPVEHTA